MLDHAPVTGGRKLVLTSVIRGIEENNPLILNDAVHAASLFKFSKDKPAHPEKSGEANCR